MAQTLAVADRPVNYLPLTMPIAEAQYCASNPDPFTIQVVGPSQPPAMTEEIYQSAQEARQATDAFYADHGFEYTPDQVQQWLGIYLPHLLKSGCVLDPCCGDDIWAAGIKTLNPDLSLHGIDISPGAIDKAKELAPQDAEQFVVGDTEQSLPWPDGTFDLSLRAWTGALQPALQGPPPPPSPSSKCGTAH